MELDYEKAIPLDAESLAEGGIKEAYERLVDELRGWVAEPALIEELLDDDEPSYVVRCGGREYEIYSSSAPDGEGESWGRATFALFEIVNAQLKNSSHRFFAVNGGNDLCGMFLTEAEAVAARRGLPRRTDWPYLPTSEHSWYGQFH